MFLETIDGRIADRHLITIDDVPTLSESGRRTWHRIEYAAGADVRETWATPESVEQFLQQRE